jgi:hypothetical protein
VRQPFRIKNDVMMMNANASVVIAR